MYRLDELDYKGNCKYIIFLKCFFFIYKSIYQCVNVNRIYLFKERVLPSLRN